MARRRRPRRQQRTFAWLWLAAAIIVAIAACSPGRGVAVRPWRPDAAVWADASDSDAGPQDAMHDASEAKDALASEDASVTNDANEGQDATEPAGPVDDREYTVLSTRRLSADGVGVGMAAYDLIRAFGGSRPIESPDLYPENHPQVPHIVEAHDDIVGDHFAFSIHRDVDIDRDRTEITDRQRNEIKGVRWVGARAQGFRRRDPRVPLDVSNQRLDGGVEAVFALLPAEGRRRLRFRSPS